MSIVEESLQPRIEPWYTSAGKVLWADGDNKRRSFDGCDVRIEMLTSLAADLVVLVHFGFILFVVAGGTLVLRWPRVAWLHLPAAAWGAGIELLGGVCPLTPLEKALRRAAGDAGYEGSFIGQYLVPVIYPAGLTYAIQTALGLLVIAVNLVVYAIVLKRGRRRTAKHCSPS